MTWRKRIIIGVSITFSGLLLSLTKNLFLEILGLIFVLTGFILVLQGVYIYSIEKILRKS
ncbi:MAG: hypothetical protein GU359_02370 [Desulfurococcales archaeon]|jgi:uncharacterized membrane protein|nr:hypothetical protein [Desulfurococcales archaeon]